MTGTDDEVLLPASFLEHCLLALTSWPAVYAAICLPGLLMVVNFIFGECIVADLLEGNNNRENADKEENTGTSGDRQVVTRARRIGRVLTAVMWLCILWQFHCVQFLFHIPAAGGVVGSIVTDVEHRVGGNIGEGSSMIVMRMVFSFRFVNACLTMIVSGLMLKCNLPPPPPPQQPQQLEASLPSVNYCRRCDRMIVQQDHHCYFINNCVGQHNRRAFISVLLLTLLMTMLDGYYCGQEAWEKYLYPMATSVIKLGLGEPVSSPGLDSSSTMETATPVLGSESFSSSPFAVFLEKEVTTWIILLEGAFGLVATVVLGAGCMVLLGIQLYVGCLTNYGTTRNWLLGRSPNVSKHHHPPTSDSTTPAPLGQSSNNGKEMPSLPQQRYMITVAYNGSAFSGVQAQNTPHSSSPTALVGKSNNITNNQQQSSLVPTVHSAMAAVLQHFLTTFGQKRLKKKQPSQSNSNDDRDHDDASSRRSKGEVRNSAIVLPSIVFAGRTDAGVHALGMVLHVDLPVLKQQQPREKEKAIGEEKMEKKNMDQSILLGLRQSTWQVSQDHTQSNSNPGYKSAAFLLPKYAPLHQVLTVVDVRAVPHYFHARVSATSRTYHYHLVVVVEEGVEIVEGVLNNDGANNDCNRSQSANSSTRSSSCLQDPRQDYVWCITVSQLKPKTTGQHDHRAIKAPSNTTAASEALLCTAQPCESQSRRGQQQQKGNCQQPHKKAFFTSPSTSAEPLQSFACFNEDIFLTILLQWCAGNRDFAAFTPATSSSADLPSTVSNKEREDDDDDDDEEEPRATNNQTRTRRRIDCCLIDKWTEEIHTTKSQTFSSRMETGPKDVNNGSEKELQYHQRHQQQQGNRRCRKIHYLVKLSSLSFMKRQVRCMVGTAVAAATGVLPPTTVASWLALDGDNEEERHHSDCSSKRSNDLGKEKTDSVAHLSGGNKKSVSSCYTGASVPYAAPPQGLTLVKVEYPLEAFTPSESSTWSNNLPVGTIFRPNGNKGGDHP